MKNNVSKIFDEIAAANNIGEVNQALEAVDCLDADAKADFTARLTTEFAKKADSKEGFSVMSISVLDPSDFSKGFRILFKQPKP